MGNPYKDSCANVCVRVHVSKTEIERVRGEKERDSMCD